MNRKSITSPFNLPSNTEFQRFEKRHIGGPSAKDFRVQLVGSLACHWNSRAAAIFAETYIKAKGRAFKRDDLAAGFKVHLRALKIQYNDIKAGPSKTPAKRRRLGKSAR